MRSFDILTSASVLPVLLRGASALVARGQLPPTVSSSSFIGSATDYPDLIRDGGGGGTVNGINVVSASPSIAPPSHLVECQSCDFPGCHSCDLPISTSMYFAISKKSS